MYNLGLRQLNDPRRDEFTKLALLDEAQLKQIPDIVDYRAGNPQAGNSERFLYPGPYNQDPWGTCVGFGCAKRFEFTRGKRTGRHERISVRALFSEIKRRFYPDDRTDDGAQVSDGLRILEEYYTFEDEMPYDTTSFDRILDVVPEAIKHRDFEFKGFVAVQIDVTHFEAALYKHGPIVVGAQWPNAWYNTDAQGRVAITTTDIAGGHCYVIVGFNRTFVNIDGSKGAWVCQNNWSEQWGHNGYFFIPYACTSNIMDAFTVAG